jgi:hypothetical protein
VNSFVGAFHDAVLLYALAVNETLEAGIDPINGSEVTKRMWNKTFKGLLMHEFRHWFSVFVSGSLHRVVFLDALSSCTMHAV